MKLQTIITGKKMERKLGITSPIDRLTELLTPDRCIELLRCLRQKCDTTNLLNSNGLRSIKFSNLANRNSRSVSSRRT